MLKFIIRRLLQLVVVLFILSVLLFAWLRALPGGVVSAMLGERSAAGLTASVATGRVMARVGMASSTAMAASRSLRAVIIGNSNSLHSPAPRAGGALDPTTPEHA